MTLNLKMVPVDRCDYPFQPRSKHDPAHCCSLGESMKAIGQKVPIIGYTDPASGIFKVIDGGCRLIGARQVGITELLALDLGKEPTLKELLMSQAAIDLLRQHLHPMDRARLWQANIRERGCTARQMAKEMGVDESLVGDYLSLLKLPPDVQEQVNSGALHMSKAGMIAQQERNPDRQRELATQAVAMSRDELAAILRQNRRNAQQAPVVRLSRVKCPLPSGIVSVVSGEGVSLDESIEALGEAIKEMKRARDLGFTAKTFAAAMKDKAKQAGV
jgi:ParB family chromosome partitioning protein